jgi:hypothetical protein
MDSATSTASLDAEASAWLGGVMENDAVAEPEQRAEELTARFDGADAETLLRLALTL